MNLQPILENEQLLLLPLQEADFDALYALAADPKIWEQHPAKDRWKKEVFRIFFEGAMQSKGAFKIIDKATGDVIGNTRYYNYQPETKTIEIGFTFYGTNSWGKNINPQVKKLMLDYIFEFVNRVTFTVGALNIRSQTAIQRLGAKKMDIEKYQSFGGDPLLHYMYAIDKKDYAL